MWRASRVTAIRAGILDLPIRRVHTFGSLAVTEQSYPLARVQTKEGIEPWAKA